MIFKILKLIDFHFLKSNQIITAYMNSNYKQSGDTQAILQWFQQYPYPHCKKINNLASLRSGVAIAEVMTHKLPPSYHPSFIPNIQIYNLNPQRSILNLKVLLNSLKAYYSQHQQLNIMIDEFNAQGLYFDHNMMQTFIFTILMPLKANQKEYPTHEFVRQTYLHAQEMSDIANLSSIIISNQYKQEIEQNYKQEKNQSQKKVSQNIQNERINSMPIKVQKWLLDYHHINVNKLNPDQILGQLINSMFSGSRLDKEKIVKNSHYELGPITVFKKVCDYLLECERMPKHNVFTLIQELQVGCIRQQILWMVIEDLMNIKISYNLNTNLSRRKTASKQINVPRDQLNDNKENIPKSAHNLPKSPEELIKPHKIVLSYSQQMINQAENWIKNDLGYEHSLNKSKKIVKILQNPVLNGVLLGSIIMRLQLGKVNIIKQPKNKEQLHRNISEVSNCIIRRGLQSGRKFSNLKATYNNYIGIIWQVKKQMQAKSQLQKLKRIQKRKEDKQLSKQINQHQKSILNEWLQSKGIVLQRYPFIPSNVITQICGEMLELRLLRQTTKRIKQLNMMKILEQLRRVGWQCDCEYNEVLSQQGSNIRWSMIKFSYQLLKHNVYYYR